MGMLHQAPEMSNKGYDVPNDRGLIRSSERNPRTPCAKASDRDDEKEKDK